MVIGMQTLSDTAVALAVIIGAALLIAVALTGAGALFQHRRARAVALAGRARAARAAGAAGDSRVPELARR